MQRIEALLVLPVGASLIDEYSRNYAPRDDGKVVAAYLIPTEPTPFDVGCDVVLENFETRPCTEEEILESREREQAYSASIAAAGESRWLKDPDDLPMVLDGGCSYISIVFDPEPGRFDAVRCNGSV